MKEIVFSDSHRQKHFDFFNAMSHPHFSITANVDVTEFMHLHKNNDLLFTDSIVFLVSKAANEIKEFRRRIRKNRIWQHEMVHPSFTVSTEASDIFSFCTVTFDYNPQKFLSRSLEMKNKMNEQPSFEDEKGRDDFLFMSSIPWVSFTSFQHAMNYHPTDSVPRFVWGKVFKQENRMMMPVSVQVHHAVVDGQQVGLFFEKFNAYLADCESVFHL